MSKEQEEARREFFAAQAAKARQDVENARKIEEARTSEAAEGPSSVWEQWIEQQMEGKNND